MAAFPVQVDALLRRGDQRAEIDASELRPARAGTNWRSHDLTIAPGAAGAPVCNYSTVPVLLVDEAARTATILHHYVAPAALYSYFGGQAELLANGDFEADFCAAAGGATVQEYQPGAAVVETAPQIVWQAISPGYDQYRSIRVPSLYPGVQW